MYDAEANRAFPVPGTGHSGFNGDDKSGTLASLCEPEDIAVDTLGNLYIADRGNQRIRRVDSQTGMISSLGGVGTGSGASDRSGPIDVARRYCGEVDGRIADPVARDRLTRLRMDERAFSASMRRSIEEAKAGMPPGPASSMFKLYGTEQNKNKYELLASAMGTQFLGWEGDSFSADERTQTRAWLRSKANSIEGGTSEVQLNIIAKRILGLPD